MFRRVGLVYFLPVANVAVTWPPSPFYRHIWEQFHPTMKAKRCLFALKICGRTKTKLPEQMSVLLDFWKSVLKIKIYGTGPIFVEDKFYEFLMYDSTNEMNVRGVEEAGTHFCGITKGYRALRTNTTLLNQNAGYKIIYRVFSIYIVPSPVHF